MNVISRFASDRRTWDDIVAFEFFPQPDGDLDGPERRFVCGIEDLGSERETGISAVLPWDRQGRTRPGEGVLPPALRKRADLAVVPGYPEVRAAVGMYLSLCIPDPFNTRRYLCIVSRLPSTGRSQEARRLLTVNCGNLETLHVGRSIEEDSYDGVFGRFHSDPPTADLLTSSLQFHVAFEDESDVGAHRGERVKRHTAHLAHRRSVAFP